MTMVDNSELVQAILAESFDEGDKKKLNCAKAFELAAKFDVSKKQVRQLCDDNNIKIANCQLGCFE